jgi:hypothetical protein
MNSLKKIYCNCYRATFLIEKKQLDSIRFNEHLELAFHLACCPPCRTYQKQSHLINRSLKGLIAGKLPDEAVLDEQFKQDIQQKISKQLDSE